jgi:hypothetical protein
MIIVLCLLLFKMHAGLRDQGARQNPAYSLSPNALGGMYSNKGNLPTQAPPNLDVKCYHPPHLLSLTINSCPQRH